MPLIQKPVPGLAKFLGVETQGLLRLNATTDVVPVLEVEDYLSPNPWLLKTFSLAAVGNRESVTVPNGEFWRLKWLSIELNSVVGNLASVDANMEKTFSGSTYNIPLTPRIGQYINNVQVYDMATGAAGYAIDLKGLNAEAGTSVGVRLRALAGVAAAVTGHFYLQYQKLDI